MHYLFTAKMILLFVDSDKKQDAYYTKFTFNNFCYRYENVYIFSIMLILVFLCKTSSTLILLQKFHILFYILSEFHIMNNSVYLNWKYFM
jgi:hypothetical protein